MCETRNEQRQQREAYDEENDDQKQSHKRTRRKTVRLHGSGPREGTSWSLQPNKPNSQRKKQYSKHEDE